MNCRWGGEIRLNRGRTTITCYRIYIFLHGKLQANCKKLTIVLTDPKGQTIQVVDPVTKEPSVINLKYKWNQSSNRYEPTAFFLKEVPVGEYTIELRSADTIRDFSQQEVICRKKFTITGNEPRDAR
jgi:hypothetical protein